MSNEWTYSTRGHRVEENDKSLFLRHFREITGYAIKFDEGSL